MEKNETLKQPRKITNLIKASLGRLSSRAESIPEETKAVDFAETVRELAGQGFDTLSYGRGPWITDADARVIDEWAIKNPDGRVTALTVYKTRSFNGATVRSNLQRSDFDGGESYTSHTNEWQLGMSEATPLSDMLATLPPQVQPEK